MAILKGKQALEWLIEHVPSRLWGGGKHQAWKLTQTFVHGRHGPESFGCGATPLILDAEVYHETCCSGPFLYVNHGRGDTVYLDTERLFLCVVSRGIRYPDGTNTEYVCYALEWSLMVHKEVVPSDMADFIDELRDHEDSFQNKFIEALKKTKEALEELEQLVAHNPKLNVARIVRDRREAYERMNALNNEVH